MTFCTLYSCAAGTKNSVAKSMPILLDEKKQLSSCFYYHLPHHLMSSCAPMHICLQNNNHSTQFFLSAATSQKLSINRNQVHQLFRDHSILASLDSENIDIRHIWRKQFDRPLCLFLSIKQFISLISKVNVTTKLLDRFHLYSVTLLD